MSEKRLRYFPDVDKLDRYLYTSEEGKKRLAEVEEYFPILKKFLGKKILDLGCGAGLFTFWLEEKGYEVTGIDKSKLMIKHANLLKEKLGFKSKFILGDAENVRLDEKFDTLVSFGNVLWAIPPVKFVRILKNLNNYLQAFCRAIIHYKPSLPLLESGKLKRSELKHERIVSIYVGYDDEACCIDKVYIDTCGKKLPLKNPIAVWSRNVVEAIFLAFGFKLVKRIEIKETSSLIDVYERC